MRPPILLVELPLQQNLKHNVNKVDLDCCFANKLCYGLTGVRDWLLYSIVHLHVAQPKEKCV